MSFVRRTAGRSQSHHRLSPHHFGRPASESGNAPAGPTRLVNSFRERRPNLTYGRAGWDASSADDRLGEYILDQAQHHVRRAWQPDWDSDALAISWLDDYTQQQVTRF